ncbi:hypothetical protein V8C44DRAFT_344206 [Trichoderma aethiopicum]
MVVTVLILPDCWPWCSLLLWQLLLRSLADKTEALGSRQIMADRYQPWAERRSCCTLHNKARVNRQHIQRSNIIERLLIDHGS